MTTAAVCPYCGTDTGVERVTDPELDTLSLTEFDTLVRNEWRRRLGRSAYARAHSTQLIRALFALALAPSSPIRSLVVEQLLWREFYRWGGSGLSRPDIETELRALAGAFRDVLNTTWGHTHRSQSAADVVDQTLREILV